MTETCEFARPEQLSQSRYAAQFARMYPLAHRVDQFWRATDRPRTYTWPYHPLVEWSRRVEYPFCADKLTDLKSGNVLDAGSGVTFFPFFLAYEQGLEVTCMDVEPEYADKLRAVGDWLGGGRVSFRLGSLGDDLPFADETFAACTCISVLEHLPRDLRLRALRELWRVTARGGRIIITCDVALESNAEGLLFEEILQLLDAARALGASITVPAKPDPAEVLTPQNPGFGLCPLRYRGWIVRPGFTSTVLRAMRASLPGFPRIACLLWSMTRCRDR